MRRVIEQVILRNGLDATAAAMGIALGVVVSLLTLKIASVFSITLGPIVAVVCLLYIRFRGKLLTTIRDPVKSDRIFIIATIVLVASFSGMLVSLSSAVQFRPLSYFILASLTASMIALQTLNSYRRSHTVLIIFEILVLSLSISAAAYWVLPSVPGSDPWYHSAITRLIVSDGSYPGSFQGGAYGNFPMMHLMVSAIELLTGASPKASLFLGVSLPLTALTMTAFLIGRRLVNTRVGLLAMLLLGVADHFVLRAIQPIPTSFGLAFFAVILFLLVRERQEGRRRLLALILILLLALIMSHSLSGFVMLYSIFCLAVGTFLFRWLRSRNPFVGASTISARLIVVAAVAVIGYWLLPASAGPETAVFEKLAVPIANDLGSAELQEYASVGIGAGVGYGVGAGWARAANLIGYLILVAFGVVGCLLLLTRDRRSQIAAGLIAVLVGLMFVNLGMPAFGINSLVPSRWFSFVYVPLAPMAALGLLTVISTARWQWLGNALVASIVLFATFSMITNKISNMDSPVYTLS